MENQFPFAPRDQCSELAGDRQQGASVSNATEIRGGIGERLTELGCEEHAVRLGDRSETITRLEDHRLSATIVLLRAYASSTSCGVTMIRQNPVRPDRPDSLSKTSHDVRRTDPA
jgi:hypothetical protein